MEIRGSSQTAAAWAGEAIALGFFESETVLTVPENLTALDERLSGVIAEVIAETEFKGKSGKLSVTRLGSGAPIKKLLLVGLGNAEKWNSAVLRSTAAAIARAVKGDKAITTLGLQLPVAETEAITAQMVTEGMYLGFYEDNRFKSEQKDPPALEAVEILGIGDQPAAIALGTSLCEGVIYARELVNAPANIINPVTLAASVESLASTYGLELNILEEADCEAAGMGSFLGVAAASDLPPKFIHLVYKPLGTPRKKVAIVGKGLTFDSGGYNIKPSGPSIAMMKMDMGGAAATFGAAKAIAELKPDVEVHFISAATENMISGRGMRPGDILTASNGKTIEVNNTDAEGRLTLADALVYAEKLGVEAIVDIATLTGACVIALGDDICGLWSDNDDLAQAIATASEKAGEKFWQMPLEEKYFEGLKSPIADMKNTGPREGGSITAALFLKEFVENTPWAHLDIAGPAWSEKDADIYSKGGTGFPVRTLVHWVLS
ncbi:MULTISPECIES: leucyl aminopeptidase [Cyanophyceae]|uniref:Probable cytosol aminopeptidase n=1 Tax=Picosynechococcus sp. (strain ATCC 27264 / PCC 7002 / PR-6) TaxID=32049 RepID=AMPA_PICP2|nr:MULTISPECIES: leucyl aminopeptidase [Cyanophyceae]B1XK83.1 RecName: Full=Probable cytosol aminopeptidase; AltName: Full=Leucine aminopeptidase; Short=LAP; AltName: Full=Leucyl aminopeptidase [Picosynechococcus sp. PCC 7002]ACB00438.1 cytosol aminopeptidase [Picosynechococcus sp. PCC 7002]SMH49339.1 leucyl aminopeptidase [Picosynechococcus sp. OG1]SMQ81561.1 leucyl aminopeptidase [Synechococcus sp. 7002]